MFQKMAFSLVLIPLALGLSACNGREAAVGVGVVGGAIIGAAVADHVDRCDRYVSCDSYGRCDDGSFYQYGRYDRCYDDGYYGAKIGTPEARALAHKYSLSVVGAQTVVNAVATAKAGQLDGFTAIGFTDSDMNLIANGQMPSHAAIRTASKNLLSSQKAVVAILHDTLKEVRTQRALPQQPE